ncbi:MAG: hypothetical protein WCO44_17515 [Bacteroidota bacterium]
MTRIALKPLLFFTLFLAVFSGSYAQDSLPSLRSKPRNPDNFWKRVTVGGNLGLQFGSVTGITIAPEARVRTVDQLYVGVRFTYQYIHYKNYLYDPTTRDYLSFQSNVFGGSLYLRYYLSGLFENSLRNVFAHVEYEYLVYEWPYIQDVNGSILGAGNTYYSKGNEVIRFNSFFIGGGYRQPVSSHFSMEFLLLFNINDTYNSPYTNPIFRLGVGYGF